MRNTVGERNRPLDDSHRLHRLEHAFGTDERTALIGIGADHHELVTAHAEQQVGFAQQLLHRVHYRT